MLKKTLTRRNKKGLSSRHRRRTIHIGIVALGLLGTLTLGAVLGPWRNSVGARKLRALVGSPLPAPAALPSPDKPTKEYIYAGGKLIATEEPASGGATHSLNASPASVAPSGNITLNWTALSGHSTTDWIGLFASGTANTAHLSFQYVPGGTSGTMTFSAPANSGSYEFRYLPNNGTTSVASSNSVTVANSYLLSASPASVAPGGNITLNWTAPSGHSTTDWIGLFASGTANNGQLSYQYVPGGTSGTMIFSAPANAGSYEFRYLPNNGYTSVASSGAVSVTVANSNPQLSASPASVAPGGKITLSWTAPSGHPTTDWIGLFATGTANTAHLSYQYVPGGASGTMTFSAPTNAGRYEFRYLPNNGYTSVATSSAVTVP